MSDATSGTDFRKFLSKLTEFEMKAEAIEPTIKFGTASATQGPPADPPSPPGGDDGGAGQPYDGGMEARVTILEAKLDHIEKEVSATKWWVAGSTITIVLTMIAAVLGTGVAIQQMTVATFQAAGAQASPPQPAQPPIIINVPSSQPAPAVAPPAAPAK